VKRRTGARLHGSRQRRRSRSARSQGRIGRDLADRPAVLAGRTRRAAPWIALALLAALLLAALRVDVIRMRYAQAEALAAEQRLIDRNRDLTVRMRQLRDPARLAERAQALGFVRPERVIDLPDPAHRGVRLADVAAPPTSLANAGTRTELHP